MLIAAVLCAVVAGVTCARIEVLNHIAGNRLPNGEEDGKWHVGPGGATARQWWRRDEANALNDPTLLTRPLTTSEQQRQDAFVRRQDADGTLRDVVGTWGLLQYVLVPAGLVMGQLLMWADPRRLERRVGLVITLTFAACGTSMLGRAYFTSLGW